MIILFSVSGFSYSSQTVADKIIQSLKTEPNNWTYDAYKLYYFKNVDKAEKIPARLRAIEADLVIWIANGSYGIQVEKPVRVIFTKDQKQEIWKIYQMWASKFASTKIFNQLPERSSPKEITKNEEETTEIQYSVTKGNNKKTLTNIIYIMIMICSLFSLCLLILLYRKKESSRQRKRG